jgi:CRISPR-associated exonuclease Cas4
MRAHYILVAIAVVVTAALLQLWAARRRHMRVWMPIDLKRSRLVEIETDLVIEKPVPIIGRPDRVYRDQLGEHTPVEFKNRNTFRTYDTDVAEISLRAWLLRVNGRPTTPHGYMVIDNRTTRERKAVRIALKSDRWCEALVEHHQMLLANSIQPNRVHGPKCSSCGHNSQCNAPIPIRR